MAISSKILDRIPLHDQMICRGDDRMPAYQGDTLVRGSPDLVFRTQETGDLKEILQYCHRERLPVTVCGNRTGLTGAAVAMEGLLVAMEKKNHLLDISVDPATSSPVAKAEPGIVLGDFQRAVSEAGFFYPPDPTSRLEAQLGGTIATNATGEDSLLYGPTRRYVRRLEAMMANGERLTLERKTPYRGPTKNRAGYWMKGDPIDLFIGSEGTLGIITEITVDLLPPSPDYFSAWAFFPNLTSALQFVVAASGCPLVKPRALEIVDRPSLEIVSRQERSLRGARHAGSAVYFKQEFADEEDRERLLSEWLSLLEPILKGEEAPSLLDDVEVALDPPSQEHFRNLRHAIPSHLYEAALPFVAEGAGKITTDWWVPLPQLLRAMTEVIQESDRLGLPYFIYGHIGDGHPHISYLARSRAEKQGVEEIVLKQCRRAASWGGGVAGEHGIGKTHRNYLPLQCSRAEIDKMISIKQHYDPFGILGSGTLF